MPITTDHSFKTSPPSGGALLFVAWSLPGLVWLNAKCLMRSWRWRAFAAIGLGLAFFFSRGEEFGAGSLALFPGGAFGVNLFTAMIVFGTMILAVDLASQPEDARARFTVDCTPAPGLVVQSARALAITLVVFPLALAIVFFPFLPWLHEVESPLWMPSIVYLACVIFPLIWISATAGIAARALVRNDVGAMALGLIVATVACCYTLFYVDVLRIFLSASRTIGVFVPTSVLVQDAVVELLAGVCFLGLSALALRPPPLKTPVASIDPPRASGIPLFGRLGYWLAAIFRRPTLFGILALTFFLVGSAGLAQIGRWAAGALYDASPLAAASFWETLREPSGSVAGIVQPPRIRSRQLTLPSTFDQGFSVTMTLDSITEDPQSVAALSFGPTLGVTGLRSLEGNTQVELLQSVETPEGNIALFRFSPPLDRNRPGAVTFDLEPTAAGSRRWAEARHPRFVSLARVPLWYGEGVRVDFRRQQILFTTQPAPYELEVPAFEDLKWHAGTMNFKKTDAGWSGSQTNADLPVGLVAGDYVEVPSNPDAELDVRMLVFPEHRDLAEALQTIYTVRFHRLFRAFGPASASMTFYEIPGEEIADLFALSSSTLDELQGELEKYGSFEENSAWKFDQAFARFNRAIIEEYLITNFTRIDDPELLLASWVGYLHQFGFAHGQTRELLQRRRDFVLVPWNWARPTDRYPFDVVGNSEMPYRGPALYRWRPEGTPPPSADRLMAFHHMLRAYLGEEAYVEFLHRVLKDYQGKVLTLDGFRSTAESVAGEDLGWFFDQWLVEGVLPTFKFREAQVVLAENPDTRNLEYTTHLIVANTGDGRVKVPVVLRTEGDSITEWVWLDAGGEATLQVVTRDRPFAVEIDPDGWILQRPAFDSTTKQRPHPQLALKNVKEM